MTKHRHRLLAALLLSLALGVAGGLYLGIRLATKGWDPGIRSAQHHGFWSYPVAKYWLSLRDLDEGMPYAKRQKPDLSRLYQSLKVQAGYENLFLLSLPFPLSKIVIFHFTKPVMLTELDAISSDETRWITARLNQDRIDGIDYILEENGVFDTSQPEIGDYWVSHVQSRPLSTLAWDYVTAHRIATRTFPNDLTTNPLFELERVRFRTNVDRAPSFFWRLKNSPAPYFIGDDGTAYQAVKGYIVDGQGYRLIYGGRVYLKPLDFDKD